MIYCGPNDTSGLQWTAEDENILDEERSKKTAEMDALARRDPGVDLTNYLRPMPKHIHHLFRWFSKLIFSSVLKGSRPLVSLKWPEIAQVELD